MNNMFVVSTDNISSKPMWLILATGINNIAVIDAAFTKEKAYAKIEQIKSKMTQPGQEKYRRDMEDIMDGVVMRTIDELLESYRSTIEY